MKKVRAEDLDGKRHDSLSAPPPEPQISAYSTMTQPRMLPTALSRPPHYWIPTGLPATFKRLKGTPLIVEYGHSH